MILLLDSLNHSPEPSVRWRIGEEDDEEGQREPEFIYLKTTRAVRYGKFLLHLFILLPTRANSSLALLLGKIERVRR